MSVKRNKPEDEDSFEEVDTFKKGRVAVRTPTEENKEEIEKQKMEGMRKLLMEMIQKIKSEIQVLKTVMKEENK